jgi:tetratricopeptide (TPR) repeat protein
MVRRRTVLALMVVGVVPAFALINSFVGTARTSREAIAVEWARRGDADLAGGRAEAAADDYRTADEYARQRNTYQLQLATALVAADRLAEAEAQLQTRWSETPGDGVINLQLARIAARQQRVSDAVRYYHAAIDGLWTTADPVAVRRHARLELAQFLLARGERMQAQVELVALAADPPPTAEEQVDVARLLIDADADNRALTLLAAALRLDPANARAASLAGTVEARLGNYRDARAYLERARRADGLDPDGAALLDTVTRVLDLDPDARGISSRERLRRTVRAFAIGSAALDRCPAEPLGDLRERRDRMVRQVTERTLARDPDAVDDTLAFAASAIDAVRTACGEGGPDERALKLVFQRRPTS